MATGYRAFSKCIGCNRSLVNGEIMAILDEHEDGIPLNIECPNCKRIMTTSRAYVAWEQAGYVLRWFTSKLIRFYKASDPNYRFVSDDVETVRRAYYQLDRVLL